MGISASQARFLMLTARKSDLEYQIQQINQERLSLADNMEGLAKSYNDKLNNTVLVYRSAQDNANYTLTYDAITKSVADGGMGMCVVNSAGKILVASDDELEGLSEEEKKNYLVDSELKDTETLVKNLQDGYYFVGQKNGEEVEQFSLDGLSEVTEIYDTSDDALAESEYDSKMTTLQHEDKTLELQITQIESEHQAIQTEIDSIKSVIDKNIESSFKTFGGS